MQGLPRDKIAEETGVSAGGVSGVIREFTDGTAFTSIDEAAEKYDVVETVEDLRSLALEIGNAGTTIEELVKASKMLERIRKLISLDRLEEFIKAGESLKDKAHVEASVRMHMIEERLGKPHDDILTDLKAKEIRLRELNPEIQRLNSQVKNLESEMEKAETDFSAQKAKLDAELEKSLKEHSLTLERIKQVSEIETGLSSYDIELTRLEGLLKILDTVEEEGQDANKLVELAKKVGWLRAQADRIKEQMEIQKAREEKVFNEGYNEAKKKYLVTFPCSICAKTIEIAYANTKEVAKYLKEHGWAHTACYKMRKKV